MGVQAFAFYSRLFKDLPSNIDVLEQVSACSVFLSLFFNQLILLVEQLACAVRRLAGDVLHRHALLEIGSTMGPSWRLGAAVERVGEDQPKPESVNRDE